MPSYLHVDLERGTFNAWFGGTRRNRETGEQEELPPPEHPCSLGPYDGVIDPASHQIKPAVLELLRKGDLAAVKGLPVEEVLEPRELAPDTAFTNRFSLKEIIAAMHAPEQHPEILAAAAEVKEYYDAAEAEEAEQKRKR